MISHTKFRLFMLAVALLGAACSSSSEEGSPTTSTAPTTASTTAPETTSTSTSAEPATSTTDSTLITSVPPSGCAEGEPEVGFVTGVADFVNVRAETSVNSAVLAELPPGAQLAYYPESLANNNGRAWLAVKIGPEGGDQDCGAVAAEYIKDSDGRIVGFVNAVNYVTRAMFGREPETAHATYTQNNADSPKDPFDESELDAPLAALRQLGDAHPTATVRFDQSVPVEEGAPNGVGCNFVDGLFCQVEIVDGEVVIATVGVGWYGDGISVVDVLSS